LSLQEGKKNIFLILRKNFRGFFASSETPISVIEVFFNTEEDLTLKSKKMQKTYFPFFLKKSNNN
jgi:hypothetical protein